MKKEYIKPTMEVIPLDIEAPLLADSGMEDLSGRDNACTHGNVHKWFCDND